METNPFPPVAVLAQYPLTGRPEAWTPLPNDRAGFSGSRIWFEEKAGLVLKAIPVDGKSIPELAQIHRWVEIAKEVGIETLPTILRSIHGTSTFEFGSHYWVLMTKSPGRADFRDDTNDRRLWIIMKELAQLHRIFYARFGTLGPIPGVSRRLAKLDNFSRVFDRFDWRCLEKHSLASNSGWDLVLYLSRNLPGQIARAMRDLERLKHYVVPIHPCLCDCWHDHFLFEGDQLTGIIDLDAMKIDHPAVDLARSITSLLPFNRELWPYVFGKYLEAGAVSDFPFEWIEILSDTGQIVAGLHWLQMVTTVKTGAEFVRISGRLREIIATIRPLRT